jgi:hypothetical protein
MGFKGIGVFRQTGEKPFGRVFEECARGEALLRGHH